MLTLFAVLALLIAENLALDLRHVPGKNRNSSLVRHRRSDKTHKPSCITDYKPWNGMKFFTRGDAPELPSFIRAIATNIAHIITPLPLDPEIEKLLDHHKEENQDYEFRLYDTPQMIKYMQDRELTREMDAFNRLNHVVMQADLFRLILMVYDGGVYFDDKAGIKKPLRHWLPSAPERAVFMSGHCGITNWFMSAKRGHPVMVALLETLVNKILHGFVPANGVKFDAKVWWLTGPFHYTSTLAKLLGEDAIPCHLGRNPTCPYEKTSWIAKSWNVSYTVGNRKAEVEIMNGKYAETFFVTYRMINHRAKGKTPSRSKSYHTFSETYPMYKSFKKQKMT